MNKVIMIGNLVADPTLRQTNTGLSVCSFRIAVTRRFANPQGVRESDFFDVVAWRQTAEFISKYFTKGRKIAITGSLQSRNYEAKDGTKRTAIEIQVDEAEFVDSKRDSEGGGSTQTYVQPDKGSAPQPSARSTQAPTIDYASQGFTQADDDELPF